MDIAEFLLGRIADDEALARSVVDEHPMNDWESYVSSAGFYEMPSSRFAIDFNPERVLVECKVKRELIAMHATHFIDSPRHCQPNKRVLQVLALPYTDHSDYDESWRP